MGKPKCKLSEVAGLDSGWSWVIAGACCFTNCMVYGVSRMSGMLLHPAVETYGVSRGAAALPFTTSSAVRNLSGPIVGFLGQHFGIRPVAAVGCVLASLGAGLCFFTPDIIWTTVCWGGMFGIGSGLCTSLLPSAINQHFDKHTATASGISYSGSFIGSFMFPSLVLFLLDKYGLPGTFLVLSGFILNSLVAVVLLRPPRLSKSTSNYSPVYTISKHRNNTSSLQEVKIDGSDVLDSNCLQCTGEIIANDNENLQDDVFITEHFGERHAFPHLLEQKATSVESEGISIDILSDKTETPSQFLGFLVFTKNSNFPDRFPTQEHWEIPTTEKEKRKFFLNFTLKDIIRKIHEHITSSKNHNFNFSEKREKAGTLRFELNDSYKNSYFLLQLSSRDSETLLKELKNNNDQLSTEDCRDLILWGIFRENSLTPESKSPTRLQKFTKRKSAREYDIFNILQSSSGLQSKQVPHDAITSENRATIISQCLGLEEQKSTVRNSHNTSLLSRLARSLKGRTSPARPGPIQKSFSLDSGSPVHENVKSSCYQCFMPVCECFSRAQSCNAPLHFISSETNGISQNQNSSGKLFDIHNFTSKCASIRTSSGEMPLHSVVEHFTNTTDIIAFSKTERLLADVDVIFRRDLLQLKCVAIALLRTAKNNPITDKNTRNIAIRDSVASLDSQNNNISDTLPDENHNIINPIDKVGSIRSSKTADLSVIVVDEEIGKAAHQKLRTRLRSWCSVFSKPMFLLISLTMAIYSFVMVCIITVVEDYARDIEHSNVPKPYVLMVLSAADLCGTLGLGWITDRGFLSRKNFIAICFCGMAVSVMVIAFATQVLTLCILVAIYGIFESGVVITFPLLTAEFIRVDKQTIAIASSNLLSAPAILIVPLVIGYFRDYMGSYHELFCLLSVTSSVCGVLWLLIPYLLQKYTLQFKGAVS